MQQSSYYNLHAEAKKDCHRLARQASRLLERAQQAKEQLQDRLDFKSQRKQAGNQRARALYHKNTQEMEQQALAPPPQDTNCSDVGSPDGRWAHLP